MKRAVVFGFLAVVVLAAFALTIIPRFVVGAGKMAMPFGGEKDVEFANKLWEAMEGYMEWPIKSDVYVGKSPHGAFVRMYYSVVNMDGKPYHVIVKDNFMGKDEEGEELDLETVAEFPEDYLAAVTVMAQREAGYDPDNNDWFWVKYDADGTVGKNEQDMMLAGRVAKGMEMGCIACHKGAKDNDYVFFNDGEM